jgi:uncharacterized membrane protein
MPRRGRLDPLALLCAATVALVLCWLSVARYMGYNASMLDLGNMAQAIGSVWRGLPLVCTFPEGPISRLALHVELIYYLFALPYAIWPDPRVLLVGQALLFASGAVPTYRLGLRATQSRLLACCLALIYLLYPVAQTAVLYDFHGDTLAMPLLLWALEAADRRAWRSFAVWTALALSCKFYVALPVALVGAMLWWRGERRAGALTFALALAYGALAFFVIRPLFNAAGVPTSHRGLSYLSFYFGQMEQVAASWLPRVVVALIVFGPALPLAWRGWRWLLPGLPLAAAVLISTGPGPSFHYRYHHYALVVPFIVMACVAGSKLSIENAELKKGVVLSDSNVRLSAPAHQRPRRGFSILNSHFSILLTLLLTVLLNGAVVDTPLSPGFWSGAPGRGLDPSAYGVTARDRLKDAWLAEAVPPGVPLAASPLLAPHLANRDALYLLSYPDDPASARLPGILRQVDYALADALFDYRAMTGSGVAGGVDYELREIGTLLRDARFGLVAQRDGLLLFRRDPPAGTALAQSIRPLPDAGGSAGASGDIALLSGSITPLDGRRFRARFDWLAPDVGRQPIAVSELEGVAGMRIVHLPSFALLPVAQWPRGGAVREEFDVELPGDLPPGRYSWRVAWYNAADPNAAASDERSRIGPLVTVGTVVVR